MPRVTLLLARLPAPEIPAEEARRVAQRVLADPVYAELRPSLYDRAWRWVMARVGEVLEGLLGTGTGNVIGTVIVIVALVVAALLLLRLGLGMRRDPERAAMVTDTVGRTAGAWREEAAAHERAGRFRQALRAEYRALIAELAAAGLVDEVPGRTSGEYLRAVRRDVPTAADGFADATRAFDRAWYGAAEVASPDLDRMREAARRSLAATRAGAAA